MTTILIFIDKIDLSSVGISEEGIKSVGLVSEFRYVRMPLQKDALAIVISQSGKTADTLVVLRLAKDKKMLTLAIVNVVGSSIAREADYVLYTLAGPEISVATTKA